MIEMIPSETADAVHTFYKKDQTLSFVVHVNNGEPQTITSRILKLHQPSTLSCVLTVEIPDLQSYSMGLPSQAILKLYDRRFSSQLRRDENVDPWSEATEEEFARFVSSGEASTFVERLRIDDDFEEPEEGWTPVENEAYLHNECAELFLTEVRAYNILQSFQGKQIPKLYSTASVPMSSGASNEALLNIDGLLLEYIPGPTLSEIVDRVPREKWQFLVDRAVTIVRDYSELGILNKDVRCSNFIVNETVPDEDEHRVVMLDFALCTFRDPEQSEADWGKAKWSQDEEGAVGAVMRTRLAKVGFELNYVPSHQWLNYAPGEDD